VGVVSDTGKVLSEASKWITDRTVNGVLNLMVELCKQAVDSCPKAGVTMMSVSARVARHLLLRVTDSCSMMS
jgi:hypothetical protein